MPIRTILDDSQKLIIVVFEGNISDQELKEHVEEMRNNPSYQMEYDKLIDQRNCLINMDLRNRKSIARATSERIKTVHGRIAIIASSPQEVAHGILFESALAMRNKVKVFSTLQGACEWLGKEPSIPLDE